MTVTESQWKELEQDPDVAYVQEDGIAYPLRSEWIPWGIKAIQGNSHKIPLPDRSKPCFRVCVVDSGLMPEHPDIPYSLKNNNLQGEEFGLPFGQYWNNPSVTADHGTHVAGIIGAASNDMGVVGVIPDNQNICLMVARAFPDDISSGQKISVIDEAVEWCADNGARVINLSLGSRMADQASKTMYAQLWNEGVLVVSASGNNGGTAYSYPASWDTVVSVAAVDEDRKHASYSQYNDQVDITAPGTNTVSTRMSAGLFDQLGNTFNTTIMEFSEIPSTLKGDLFDCGLALETCTGASGKVCLIERGRNTFVRKANNCVNGGGIAAIIYNNQEERFVGTLEYRGAVGIPVVSVSRVDGAKLNSDSVSVTMGFRLPAYGMDSGTSMAAPHVAGVATRIWAARPECTNAQVREALLMTAIDVGDPGRDYKTGHGFVQAEDAYNYLLQLPRPCGAGKNNNNNYIPNPEPLPLSPSSLASSGPLHLNKERITAAIIIISSTLIAMC